MVLKDLKLGQKVTIMDINCDIELKRRLMDLGITKGAQVSLKRTAPFGDPLVFVVRGYQLSIRKADSAKITVEEV